MKTPKIIDSGKGGPTLLITAGVHGNEYEPILAAYALQQQLAESLISGKLIIVPIVNSTAVAKHLRKGTDGLDLARVCPGKSNGSPTERDAAAVSELIVESDYLIDLHTGGKILDIYPLAGYMIHPSQNILDEQRKMAKAFGLPVIWGTDHEPNGRTLSVARDAKVPAIYVEYGGTISAKQSIVTAYTNGCKRVMAMLGMIENQDVVENLRLEYWTEDNTPMKGHLQSKLPSPKDGVFVPLVELGKEVLEGDLWGYVSSLEDGTRTDVFADDTGLVLFLRADAVVKKGDALGGIMSINKKTIRSIE